MRLRSGPEHRLPGPPPTHPFSRSTMSNIDPTREHPREAGSSPRVEERAYTPRGIAESNSLLRIFGMPAQHNIHARFLMIVLPRRRPRGTASHSAGTPSNKVRHRFGNLSLTVTEGNGMFQFVNQSRLKILHLWCSRCRPATRRAYLDSRFHDEGAVLATIPGFSCCAVPASRHSIRSSRYRRRSRRTRLVHISRKSRGLSG